MSTTPTRRPRHQPKAGVFVQIAPEAKDALDDWARKANVNRWEIVEALILSAQRNEGADGLPRRLGLGPAQPTLEDAMSQGGNAAVA